MDRETMPSSRDELTIEVIDRFVIHGRYREYMARVRGPDGRVLYSSGWGASKRQAEERAKYVLHDINSQERQKELHQRRAEQVAKQEMPSHRIEIEELETPFGTAYRGLVINVETGIVIHETGYGQDAAKEEEHARVYLQQMLATESDNPEVQE